MCRNINFNIASRHSVLVYRAVTRSRGTFIFIRTLKPSGYSSRTRYGERFFMARTWAWGRRTNNTRRGPRGQTHPCSLRRGSPVHENVTRYEIIVRHTKDNAGSMIGPRCVERVSRAYWSGFLLGEYGCTVFAMSEWTEDPIVPTSLFLCRWDIRVPVDRRTDRVPLSLCFNSLITIFPLVPSLSVFSLFTSLHTICFFHGVWYVHPLYPSIVSASMCFLCQSSSSLITLPLI